jgi:AraC-like DNA-binding protein
LHESWPTARLADLVHQSVAQFHARFVELTDRTPQDWLRGLRLDAAVLQLRKGRHSKRPHALRLRIGQRPGLCTAARARLTSRQLRERR